MQQYSSWQSTYGGGGGGQGASSNFGGIEGTIESLVIGAGSGTTQAQLYNGRVPSRVDSQGREIQLLYDADGNITKVTYTADNTFEEYSYNSLAQVTRKRSRTGDVELFTYDSKGNMLTHSTGLEVVNGVDTQTAAYAQSTKEYYPTGGANVGLLKTEKSPLYNASLPETLHEYDTAGRLTEITDPLGRVTQFSYNTAGIQSAIAYPDTSTEQTVYGTGTNAGRVVETNFKNPLTEVKQYPRFL